MERLGEGRTRTGGAETARFEVWHDLEVAERLLLLVEAEDGGHEILDPGRGYACLARFGHVEDAHAGLGADGYAPYDGRWYPPIDRLPRRPRATTLGSGAETAFVEAWVRRTHRYPRLALLHAATDGRIEILDPRDLDDAAVPGVEVAVLDLEQAYAVARRALIAEGFAPVRAPWRPHPRPRADAATPFDSGGAAGGRDELKLAFDHDRWSLAVRVGRAFAGDLAETVRRYRCLQGLDGPGLCPDLPEIRPGGAPLQDPRGLARLIEAVAGRFSGPHETAQCAELARFLDTAAALDATVRIEAAR